MGFTRAHLPSLVLATCSLTACDTASELSNPGPNVFPDSGFTFRPDGGFVVLPDGGIIASPPQRLSSLIVADRPPPPISGGTLAVSQDGKVAVAADPDRDAVYVVDVVTETARTVTLSLGSEPGRVALDGAGTAHVALRSADAIVAIDLATGALVKQTPACAHPRGIAHEAADDSLWVACANGELVHFARDHAELGRRQLDLDLRDVVITKSGERFVSRYRTAELLRIGADGAVVTSKPLKSTGFGNGKNVTRSPVLAWRTIADATGQPLMLHQYAQDDEVVIQQGGYGAGCQTITQSAVTRFDANGDPIEDAPINGAALSVDVAMSPDGQLLAVATPGAYLRNERGSLQLMTTFRWLASRGSDPAVTSAQFQGPGSTFFGDAGVDEIGPDAGPLLGFVAQEKAAPAGAAPFAIDAGFPSGVCFPAAEDGFDVQTTSVAFDASGHLFAFGREPASLLVYDISHPFTDGAVATLRATIALSTTSVRDTGHELFHADVGAGIACASCHGEALDDGHVWTFAGIGPRRTQTMRGGLLATLPLHWEGDMKDFAQLTGEVLTQRMGGFQVERPYSDALANWIDVQPALRIAGADEAAVARGRALFESGAVGCATCHSGAMLTNNTTVDVGTGAKLQVPSLHGLGLRAPFMHDGCAKSLTDRFDPTCGGGDRHGKTSQLTPDELRDLTSYLQTL